MGHPDITVLGITAGVILASTHDQESASRLDGKAGLTERVAIDASDVVLMRLFFFEMLLKTGVATSSLIQRSL